jgi:putative peptide zinc metalloprotease protein
MASDWYSDFESRISQLKDEPLPGSDSPAGIWKTLQKRVQIADYSPERNPAVIEQELIDRSGSYFVLKNTQENTYLRLSATEHNLWQSMDGKTSIQELIVEHFMATGEFAHTTVVRLVDMLYQKHMFTDPPISIWSEVKKEIGHRSWRYRLSLPAQKVMSQPIGYKGLDKYITILYKYGGFLFFTRPVQVLLVIISAIGLLAFSQVIRDPSYRLFDDRFLKSVALLWLAALLPIFIHELGHALTVKHFGREVPSGGFMLYFGMPAAFVETTDIWMEPKRARLAVTWNGPYTGLIVGGLAAIYIFLYPSASINSILFKVLAIAYGTVLLNLNPLLKYDGYYLLSDWLEIPSLRERSSAFIRRKLSKKILNRAKFTREEIIYTVFGILSTLWMAYALYLASSIYRSRLQTGIATLLGSNYSLAQRGFSILLIAGVLSFIFLLGLRLAGLVQSTIARYSQTGGLQRHGQSALIGSLIMSICGMVLLLSLPAQASWISPVISCLAASFAAYRLFKATPPYLGSTRGISFILVASSLAFVSISSVLQLITPDHNVVFWVQWLAVILVSLGMLLIIIPFKGRLSTKPLALGIVSAIVCSAGLFLLTDLQLSAASLLPGLIVMLSIWSASSLWGGARAPAFILLGVGSMVLNISWLVDFPYFDLGTIGILILATAGYHLVFAQLPQLSSSKLEDIPSETQKAIGTSVAILVRRLIAQVFFEAGFLGVERLGSQFTQSMHQLGVDIQISGNQFQDNELPKRSANELSEVYQLVFDELHKLLQDDLGQGMGDMAFSYGIDLLPWQTREVVSELIISRLDWGYSLGEQVSDTRDRTRKVLRRVPLFVTVTDEELDNIANHLKGEKFPAGEVIIREGEIGDKFYILERGKATVWRLDENQVEQKIDEKGPGQFFGEVALVSSAPRNATIRAETPVSTLTLDYSDFNQCVRQYINLASQVDENVKYSWLLRGMPIFDELSSQKLDQLATWLQPESLEAGEVLFHEGDQADKFYIVESGEVIISRLVEGNQVEISRRAPGEYFGEIALLQDRPRTATITAAMDTHLLSLEADQFMELTSQFMQLGSTISRASTRRLSFVKAAEQKIPQSV